MTEMELAFFFGRFHVLLLHLPIGFLVAVVLLEWLSRTPRFAHLAVAAPYLWSLAAVSAVVTAGLGYLHFSEGGFDGTSAIRHRFFGTSVAVLTCVLWLQRRHYPQLSPALQLPTGALILALLVATGHYGGNVTHGDTYLIEHAPQAVRNWAGLTPPREKVTQLAMADPFQDIVLPIFKERCVACHNRDKRRGGLSLLSHADLLKGGEKSKVVVPGDPANSDLFRRISLPPGDKDAMPAEGKTPLTGSQIALVRWWIEAGALPAASLADAKLTPEITTLMNAALGLGAAPAAGPAKAASAEALADPATVEALTRAGFQVRQRSRSDPLLSVSGITVARLSSEQLAALVAAREQIATLNLGNTTLQDRDLEQLGRLTSLTTLNLSNNRITDAGLVHLGHLSRLESLNLFGNSRISDAGLPALSQLTALKKAYLWQTRVTAAGARKLEGRLPGLVLDLGDAEQIQAGPPPIP